MTISSAMHLNLLLLRLIDLLNYRLRLADQMKAAAAAAA